MAAQRPKMRGHRRGLLLSVRSLRSAVTPIGYPQGLCENNAQRHAACLFWNRIAQTTRDFSGQMQTGVVGQFAEVRELVSPDRLPLPGCRGFRHRHPYRLDRPRVELGPAPTEVS